MASSQAIEFQIKALEKQKKSGKVKNMFALDGKINNLKKQLKEVKYQEFLAQ